jgi:hypothetical protein
MNNAVFWDVAQCRFCVNRRFGGTSVNKISTRRHIPEDRILRRYYCFDRSLKCVSSVDSVCNVKKACGILTRKNGGAIPPLLNKSL